MCRENWKQLIEKGKEASKTKNAVEKSNHCGVKNVASISKVNVQSTALRLN